MLLIRVLNDCLLSEHLHNMQLQLGPRGSEHASRCDFIDCPKQINLIILLDAHMHNGIYNSSVIRVPAA